MPFALSAMITSSAIKTGSRTTVRERKNTLISFTPA